jgi:hypothetical protein
VALDPTTSVKIMVRSGMSLALRVAVHCERDNILA